MKKNTLIIIGAVLVGAMLLGGDKEEEVIEAEPAVVETQKEEIVEVEEEAEEADAEPSKGEKYEEWLNDGLEEILKYAKRLDNSYDKLMGISQFDAAGLAKVSTDIKTEYINNNKLGSNVENKAAKEELKEIVQYIRTQDMTLSDTAKAAANGKWEKFASSNDSYVKFRAATRTMIKEMILDNQKIITHRTLEKYNEAYGEELEIVKMELDEGVTDAEVIKEEVNKGYGKEIIKTIELEGSTLKVTTEAEEDPLGIKVEKAYHAEAIQKHAGAVANGIMADVDTVEITLLSGDDKVKSKTTLETSQIAEGKWGRYWEIEYIEGRMVLGEYFE